MNSTFAKVHIGYRLYPVSYKDAYVVAYQAPDSRPCQQDSRCSSARGGWRPAIKFAAARVNCNYASRSYIYGASNEHRYTQRKIMKMPLSVTSQSL